jgi:Dynamin family
MCGSDGSRMTAPVPRAPDGAAVTGDPSAVLERAGAAAAAALAPGSALPGRLERLRERLRQERFQLAALGQFKRGKSTLLNALIGAPVLPISVVPLTAIPTFIAFGREPSLCISFHDGRAPEDHRGLGDEAIRTILHRFVTEEGNPANRLGVARAELNFPSPLLARGVVLIDTPGVGSTYSHNTETALGVLPECDAALFVISIDPPISALELDYLRRIRPHVVRIFFILNKIDNASDEERRSAAAFLRRTLEEHRLIAAGDAIFALSARQALAAREQGKSDDADDSGIAAFERHLLSFLAAEKTHALWSAVVRKADGLLGEAEAELALAIRAFELPLADLEARAASFAATLQQFETQRKSVRDLLQGERRRLAEELERQAGSLRGDASELLAAKLETAGDDAMGAEIEAIFDAALRQASADFATRADAALAQHAREIDRLVNGIRMKAAELFELPFVPGADDEGFRLAQEPYWVTEKWTTSFIPRPDRLAAALLPRRAQSARARTRARAEIDELVTRNVENLRWAILRSLDDSFRRAAARLEERLDEAIAATEGAIRSAIAGKRARADEVAGELDRLRSRSALLAAARGELSSRLKRG